MRDKIKVYGRMIKFSHTVFALPFALSAVVMAWQEHPFSVFQLVWILAAMAGARSAAMGFNRIVDAKIDLKNARTAIREIPSGLMTQKEAVFFVILSSGLFFFSAAMLSELCFFLSVPVLFFLLFYSYTKRFTRFCHLYLGFAIGLAPAGAWVAVTGTISLSAVLLSMALMTYIAGFDILYSCQDIEFDRSESLFSLPAAIGVPKAMMVSSVLHVMTMVLLLAMYGVFKMHPVFLIFWMIIGGLLVIEHWLVKPDDLTRINIAFFHMNSLVSVLLFAGVLTQGLFQ